MVFRTIIDGKEKIAISLDYTHTDDIKRLTESILTVLAIALPDYIVDEEIQRLMYRIREMILSGEELPGYETFKIG